MQHVLEATLRGPSRDELINRAKTLAATYFATPCVAVTQRNATVSGEADAPEFESSFVAQEHHDVESRSYGPGICRGCGGEDWPHSRLVRAEAIPNHTVGSD